MFLPRASPHDADLRGAEHIRVPREGGGSPFPFGCSGAPGLTLTGQYLREMEKTLRISLRRFETFARFRFWLVRVCVFAVRYFNPPSSTYADIRERSGVCRRSIEADLRHPQDLFQRSYAFGRLLYSVLTHRSHSGLDGYAPNLLW